VERNGKITKWKRWERKWLRSASRNYSKSSIKITDYKTMKILYLGQDLNQEHAEYTSGSLPRFKIVRS
jgi:hypothetical protein